MNTMFDYSDFYDNIANQLPDGCRVCEVGVADADSALYLAKKLHELGKSFKLYMVDNMDYGGMLQMKTIYENIIKSGLGEFIEVIPLMSEDAALNFNDHFLDFCFIDSSHQFEMTKREIKEWYEKIKDLGILAGHDYFSEENPGVRKAVDEVIPVFYTRPQHEQTVFQPTQVLFTQQTTNGHGVWICKKDWFIKLK